MNQLKFLTSQVLSSIFDLIFFLIVLPIAHTPYLWLVDDLNSDYAWLWYLFGAVTTIGGIQLLYYLTKRIEDKSISIILFGVVFILIFLILKDHIKLLIPISYIDIKYKYLLTYYALTGSIFVTIKMVVESVIYFYDFDELEFPILNFINLERITPQSEMKEEIKILRSRIKSLKDISTIDTRILIYNQLIKEINSIEDEEVREEIVVYFHNFTNKYRNLFFFPNRNTDSWK